MAVAEEKLNYLVPPESRLWPLVHQVNTVASFHFICRSLYPRCSDRVSINTVSELCTLIQRYTDAYLTQHSSSSTNSLRSYALNALLSLKSNPHSDSMLYCSCMPLLRSEGSWQCLSPVPYGLQGHEAPVTCCTFSSSGGTLATACEDGVLRICAPAMLPQPETSRCASLQCGAPISALAFDRRTGEGIGTLLDDVLECCFD